MWDELKTKIKVLNERVWENRAEWPLVEDWLNNFTGLKEPADVEKLHALYLLSKFMYFGDRETRALLRAMFRDAYKYPIIAEIRRNNGDTLDEKFINAVFDQERQATRFLGVGNPSESGYHLLYYFRQENRLPKSLFINTHEIFTQTGSGARVIRDMSIKRYVFLDDLCGSGKQATDYSREVLKELKALRPGTIASYYVLFATVKALDDIRNNTLFDDVACVFDLDSSFKCFADESRYFAGGASGVSKTIAHDICLHYGSHLWPSHPLGYRDGQLLLGFHHNTPDNSLPIIWADEPGLDWQPIFKRYPKELY